MHFQEIQEYGKSTLINSIFNIYKAEEGLISKRNKRGKNTTTASTIYTFKDNTYIIDTPGFSTFDISEIESKDLSKYFIEFRKEKEKCEFIDCTHIKEEKCGIKEAIENKKINIDRYNRFVKIYTDLKQKEEKKW